MIDVALAHGGLLHPFEGMTTFGADWLYVIGCLALLLVGAGVLIACGDDPGPVRDRWLRRGASGAARLTGLPPWAAAVVLTLIGFLPVLVLGFFWDVAWHIDLGRDEYLLSPPHVLLALGVGPGFAGAGLIGVLVATYSRADVAWSWRSRSGRTWRIPIASAFLLLATGVASAGWVVDELWHMMYGLDVTMWSPTHMGMIGSAFLLGAAVWLLIGEARPETRLTPGGRLLMVVLAGAVLEAFSSVQLEFDLGVAQWQMLYQPILIVMAAGLALPAARSLLGRGGAVAAVAVYVALRWSLAVLVDQVWHFTAPRFPLYLGAAVAVELAFLATRGRRARALASGLGIATLGAAGEWAWSLVDLGHLGLTHPWQLTMFPSLLWVLPVGIAASALGLALGQVATGRPIGLQRWHVGAALAVLAVGLVWPSPRIAPAEPLTVTTTDLAEGQVEVTVRTATPGAFTGAERLEVFAWQGGADPSQTDGAGRVNVPLLAQADGSLRSSHPVPVGGSWKSMVLVNDGSTFGAFPIYLPHDPEIGLAEVPVAAERTGQLEVAQAVLMREAHGEGPPWVAVLAYAVLALGLGAELLVLLRGARAIDARRGRAEPQERAPARPAAAPLAV